MPSEVQAVTDKDSVLEVYGLPVQAVLYMVPMSEQVTGMEYCKLDSDTGSLACQVACKVLENQSPICQ